jgi:ATP-dependent phosphofructokinase / diphosphate-dependent phosphofructokinase
VAVKTLGVFVAGGPAAGINGVTKGIAQEAENHGVRVYGYLNGAEGLVHGQRVLLARRLVEDINLLGGTILGTSRYKLGEGEAGIQPVLETLRRGGIEGLISIGGEGTLQLADLLRRHGIRIVHVPKTIDNDIYGIPQTFGFDTAVNEAARLLAAVKLDADSSDLWFVVEIMGRFTGHLAVEAGLAAGATRVLIPEEGPIDVDSLCKLVAARRQIGANWGVILVAESANFGNGYVMKDGRLGGVGELLAARLDEELRERQIPAKVRTGSLGYFLRCAEPTGFDKAYAARLGMAAVDLILDPQTDGHMVSFQDEHLLPIPMQESAGKTKAVDLSGIRYRALKQSESYESGTAGLLARRTQRDIGPLIVEWLRDNAVLDTCPNIAMRLGLPLTEVQETMEELVQRNEVQCHGEGPDALYTHAGSGSPT